MSKSADKSADLAKLVERADWYSLTLRLLAYAVFQLKSHDLPTAKAEEYVFRAVKEALDGKQSPASTDQSLFSYLAATVALLIQRDEEIARKRA